MYAGGSARTTRTANTLASLLIRTWNVFHGNTTPPGRTRLLERTVRLAVADEPDVVVLQELPAAALARLEGWTGYAAFGSVARRPLVPGNAGLALTDLNAGVIRSALEGQANAILVARRLRAGEHRTLVLNPRSIRDRLASQLGLGLAARFRWGRERRTVHAVRVTLPDDRTAIVANLHATSFRPDKRLADAELLRAATFADALARPGEAVVLAGDFNVTVVTSPTLRALSRPEWGFSPAGPGLDHVLVRGLDVVSPETAWPDQRRRFGDLLLSDHDPVEVEVE